MLMCVYIYIIQTIRNLNNDITYNTLRIMKMDERTKDIWIRIWISEEKSGIE